ncbi:MAG TPA: ATP-binding protein [Bacteroidales bacterium]|nr:ATP-binding protein [Bacteroidales bacterium]
MNQIKFPRMTLRSLIRQGEHQQLDFKYCISDSKKIAKTLAAFANTDGGILLLGVRDNGSIAGVESEEEYYMIDSAAKLFCKPEIEYEMQTHRLDGKTVLEVNIRKGDDKPYLARDENGRWLAYLRKEDQNLLVNRVILEVWRIEKENKSIYIKFRKAESALFNHLREKRSITLSQFKRSGNIGTRGAERILSNLISVGILEYDLTDKGCRYLPSSNFEAAETICSQTNNKNCTI